MLDNGQEPRLNAWKSSVLLTYYSMMVRQQRLREAQSSMEKYLANEQYSHNPLLLAIFGYVCFMFGETIGLFCCAVRAPSPQAIHACLEGVRSQQEPRMRKTRRRRRS